MPQQRCFLKTKTLEPSVLMAKKQRCGKMRGPMGNGSAGSIKNRRSFFGHATSDPVIRFVLSVTECRYPSRTLGSGARKPFSYEASLDIRFTPVILLFVMISAVKGMVDLLPTETWKWEEVERVIRAQFKIFGFQEIRTPMLESVELFKRGVGQETDIVSKEMYTLQDRNDQVLALRPEGTAPVIRSLIEHQWMAQREQEKVYYLGPYFRYERPQKGRQRQFHQYGTEIVGPREPLADAEIISLYFDLYMRLFKLPRVTCGINSLGCPTCVPPYREKLKSYFTKHREKYCSDCQRRMDTNPLRVLDCKVSSCVALNQSAPLLLEHLCAECVSHFERVKLQLKKSGVTFEVNPRIVRGLDYYERTTFEFLSDDLGAQSALGGGGRYDKLFEQLGGKNPLPSVGYAGGMERLMIALEATGYWTDRKPQATLFICHLGEKVSEDLLSLSLNLRRGGADVHYVYGEKSLKAQMKHADRVGARFCLIVGEQELTHRRAPLKNLRDGSQIDVSLDDTHWLKGILSR